MRQVDPRALDVALGSPFVRLAAPSTDTALPAVRQIDRLGFDPRDVRHVVLTHLDLDHAGGPVDFPDAAVQVYAEELRALQHPPIPPVGPGRRRS